MDLSISAKCKQKKNVATAFLLSSKYEHACSEMPVWIIQRAQRGGGGWEDEMSVWVHAFVFFATQCIITAVKDYSQTSYEKIFSVP